MAVVIRMKRTGRKNRPCYRISVADGRAPRDGRTLENLGLYDPVSPVEDLRLKLDVERARHWVQHGAQPSETVASIFRRAGVYEGQPAKRSRKRSGRNKATATTQRRTADKTVRSERKKVRHDGRIAAKRAVARAAKAEAAAAAAAAASEES